MKPPSNAGLTRSDPISAAAHIGTYGCIGRPYMVSGSGGRAAGVIVSATSLSGDSSSGGVAVQIPADCRAGE